MRILLAILLGITILTYTTTPASAGPFAHPPITGDTATKPPASQTAPAQPNPKKLLQAMPLALAVKHCLILEGSITEQYKLIDAFNTQPDLDNLPEPLNQTQREKIMLYMMGHPDIADFGFLIADLWKTTPRNLRLKWNALTSLRLDENLGFRSGGYPFAGNCKGKLIGEITTIQNFSRAQIEMTLAFDQTSAILDYMLSKQDGYNWQIDDLLINNVSLGNYLDKQLSANVIKLGLQSEIKSICKKSSFSNLKC